MTLKSSTPKLTTFKDSLSARVFGGLTLVDAHSQGICINCRKPAANRCYSPAGMREYQISGMCECCFDALFMD